MARVRWWPYWQDVDGSAGSTGAARTGATNPRRPAIAVAERMVAGALVLIPSALLLLRLGEPFAISAMASTTAIVLHSPNRYRRRPHVIASCYATGLAITVPITLIGMLTSMSGLLASTIAAVVIVAAPVGRVHPPTACIPLAITRSSGPAAMLLGWVTFAVVAVGFLAALWMMLTLATRRRW
ncbi:hypothetical protein DAVIS_00103 [Mycobacterium marinum]|uniref:HPP family protein n=1 Tax=Mycobacterium marinum TaxID=1781 RepID=A0A3E2N2Z7_MYCMR|nr:hypothetical protein [Mycobacterium marinum]RFZ47927.1 hypothetical protein DAVIS_00103 [Mycobacterium marinum]